MSEYIDCKIITLYPTLMYLGYLLCKKSYKYMLDYNLLILDIYDNTYDNTNDNNINIISSNKQTQTDDYLIAFNQIPT